MGREREREYRSSLAVLLREPSAHTGAGRAKIEMPKRERKPATASPVSEKATADAATADDDADASDDGGGGSCGGSSGAWW